MGMHLGSGSGATRVTNNSACNSVGNPIPRTLRDKPPASQAVAHNMTPQ